MGSEEDMQPNDSTKQPDSSVDEDAVAAGDKGNGAPQEVSGLMDGMVLSTTTDSSSDLLSGMSIATPTAAASSMNDVSESSSAATPNSFIQTSASRPTPPVPQPGKQRKKKKPQVRPGFARRGSSMDEESVPSTPKTEASDANVP